MSSTPIADLSYRHYDGKLEPPTFRWWSIAKMMMRLSIKKKGFWVWSSFSAYFYLILGAVFYFAETLSQQASGAAAMAGQAPDTNPVPLLFRNMIWKDQFLTAFNTSQLFLFIVALLIGAGSIAGDNRANALLVYLSKPCSKFDYLLGKWVGIFIPIWLVTLVPTLLFYGYCFLSYRQYGFVSQDPWLIVKLLAISPLPAAFHASAMVGISSFFNQARMAGATYAGIYFLTSFLTVAIGVMRVVMQQRRGASPLLDDLFYGSVDGMLQGLAKIILGTSGSPPFNAPSNVSMPPPPSPFYWVLFVGICLAFVALAWRRIRAVEVIG
ncbi:MAG TPA: ABC transporter permease subunit [Fimbriimonadaceae bacterium]|nr:ABC transporter permease subunit [Fimbriimonadaceae bacterium]